MKAICDMRGWQYDSKATARSLIHGRVSTFKRATEKLNHRFREHGIGYQYTDGKVIRVDSEFIHAAAHAQQNSKTEALCKYALTSRKLVLTLDSPHNTHLMALGASRFSADSLPL